MQKRNNQHFNRIRNLVFLSSLSAIILVVSTYAWFVGLRSVSVSTFDVEIASTESLLLSLDGKVWDYEVSLSKETLDDVSYEGHTNSWGGKGLIPVSSVGDMDADVSRMKLFELASFTPTPGGYRVMASRVNNYHVDNKVEPEQDGYVVFDLFIRNFTGPQYIEGYNPLDEEAIYLTTDSKVTVATSGGVEGTGIENSVRVAFAQIGRVSGATKNTTAITGITCNDAEVDGVTVTGICSERGAQIWEPNDKDHVEYAISWYDTSCLKRTKSGIGKDSYSSDSCSEVVDGTAYNTYAVTKKIDSEHEVDIYDGADYNFYTGSDGYLSAYQYFTDSHKILKGMERPLFMTLAPNSITKVRVYIYLEGQDVDNYDFAAIGKKISVNFGFTKERFTEEDVMYKGPDIEPPLIMVQGTNPVVITVDEEYEDAMVVVTDNVTDTEDITLVTEIELEDGTVVPLESDSYTFTEVGKHYVRYTATDEAGNVSTKARTVIVREKEEVEEEED